MNKLRHTNGPFRCALAFLLSAGLLVLSQAQVLHPLHHAGLGASTDTEGAWVNVCSQPESGRRLPHLESPREVWHAGCRLCLQLHRSLTLPDLRASLSQPTLTAARTLPENAPRLRRAPRGNTQPRAPPIV